MGKGKPDDTIMNLSKLGRRNDNLNSLAILKSKTHTILTFTLKSGVTLSNSANSCFFFFAGFDDFVSNPFCRIRHVIEKS